MEKGNISKKQQEILDYIKEQTLVRGFPPAVRDICKAVNLKSTSSVHSHLETLEKNGYIKFEYEKIERNPLSHKKRKKDNKLVLTEEQQDAFDQISFMIDNDEYAQFLIHGVTGSGKTEIYLQLIEKVLEKGKNAMVLVPEISLTPQIIDRFIARFDEPIAVLHSKLSDGERLDEWTKIKEGRARIVIGARSAIFAPMENLGILIIDEAHDGSYKSDMQPRYNAKDLAKYIASENNIPLVLGSATPDIVDYYKAQNGDINLITLTKRANNSKLPEVKIVDMRQEIAIGNRSMFSLELQDAIAENLKNKKQTILFINRRGFSTFVMCRDCGEALKCPNCNISLTYHSFENKLKCHYCGHEERVPDICPNCGSKKIKYFGSGTQKVENEISKLFPEATTIRMDIDTVSKKNSHEEILNRFKEEKIDILIGTQMVAKGHHFPNVTLVGIVAADGSLNIGD